MELSEINDRINSLVRLNHGRLLQRAMMTTDSSCTIDEDSDLFGFSLVHDDIDESCRSSSSNVSYIDRTKGIKDVIKRFQADNNWFNPKAVDLMCNSYGIDSNNQYDSLLLSRGVGLRTNRSTYMTIKLEQNHMFARNLFSEGVDLMHAMRYDDAVKKLSDAIHFNDRFVDAYKQRAQAYELLSMQQESLNDYNKVKELRTAVVTEADDRRGDSISSSIKLLSSNSDLIMKLQYSIYQDSSKGGIQRHPQPAAIDAAVRSHNRRSESHAYADAAIIQHILSPASSSTTDSSSYGKDQALGPSGKQDDDDDCIERRKKRRKREKKKHKKIKKKHKQKHKKQSD